MTDDRTATARPVPSTAGRSRSEPPCAIPTGSVRSAATTIASASPSPPGNTRPTRALNRMYTAHHSPATRARTTPGLARRLVLVLERDVLERVDRAEVGPAGVQRRPDLGLGQLRAALGAALLDHGLDPAGLLEVGHQSFCFVSTCVTGSPDSRS